MGCEPNLVQKPHTMYQLKVDVDMLNAVKSMLADVLSVSPSSEQRDNYRCTLQTTNLV